MKVLWVARLLPAPADSGDRLYTLGLARSLADAGAEVVLLGLADPAATAADIAALPAGVDWRRVPGAPLGRLRTVFSRLPLESKRYATAAYARALDEQLRHGRFDAVVLDHYSAAWALPLLRGRDVSIATVAHNFETGLSRAIADDFAGDPMRRLMLRMNAGRTRRAEAALVAAAALTVTITQTDAHKLKGVGARRTLTLSPGYDGPRTPLDAPLTSERRVVLLGSYRWVAKQMNLRAFLQAADARFAAAGIALDVVGDVPPRLRAELEPGLKATRLLGFVPDAGSVLRGARLGVVPEATGGGFKLKILDYVFAGLPVASLAAALEGLPDAVRRHTLGWDDLDALAEGVCATIADTARLEALRRDALAESADAYDWRARGRALRDALAACHSEASSAARRKLTVSP